MQSPLTLMPLQDVPATCRTFWHEHSSSAARIRSFAAYLFADEWLGNEGHTRPIIEITLQLFSVKLRGLLVSELQHQLYVAFMERFAFGTHQGIAAFPGESSLLCWCGLMGVSFQKSRLLSPKLAPDTAKAGFSSMYSTHFLIVISNP